VCTLSNTWLRNSNRQCLTLQPARAMLVRLEMAYRRSWAWVGAQTTPNPDVLRSDKSRAELRFKLGLPSDYAADWDALVECLSSIGDPDVHLCRYWEYTPTKRLVLSVRGFSSPDVDPTLLTSLAAAVASANNRLRDGAVENRVWMEFTVDPNA
jgi:hypothetical protein